MSLKEQLTTRGRFHSMMKSFLFFLRTVEKVKEYLLRAKGLFIVTKRTSFKISCQRP